MLIYAVLYSSLQTQEQTFNFTVTVTAIFDLCRWTSLLPWITTKGAMAVSTAASTCRPRPPWMPRWSSPKSPWRIMGNTNVRSSMGWKMEQWWSPLTWKVRQNPLPSLPICWVAVRPNLASRAVAARGKVKSECSLTFDISPRAASECLEVARSQKCRTGNFW